MMKEEAMKDIKQEESNEKSALINVEQVSLQVVKEEKEFVGINEQNLATILKSIEINVQPQLYETRI